MGWVGKSERVSRRKSMLLNPGDVVVRNARPFHAGFDGLSDTGGWKPVNVTQDMVGKTLAVYLQVEVKDKGVTSEAQKKWIEAVNRAGGIAGVVRSEHDLSVLLDHKE